MRSKMQILYALSFWTYQKATAKAKKMKTRKKTTTTRITTIKSFSIFKPLKKKKPQKNRVTVSFLRRRRVVYTEFA